MKPRYTLKEVNVMGLKELLAEKHGWGWVAGNHHGNAYWNETTGEFCWVPEVGKAKLSALTP